MTDRELIEKAAGIQTLPEDPSIPDEVIISQIREAPEAVRAKLKTGMNLFVPAVRRDRIPVAKALSGLGAGIH